MIDQLNPANPATVIEALSALRKKKHESEDSSPLPLVALFLKSGHSFSGHVIESSEVKGISQLLFESIGGNLNNPDRSAVYLATDSIEVVQILNYEAFSQALPVGALRKPEARGLTRLEFNRKIAALTEEFKATSGLVFNFELSLPNVDDHSMMRGALALFTQSLKALQQISRDSIGRNALHSIVKKTILTLSVNFSIELVDGSLFIKGPEKTTSVEIISAIEKLL